MKKIFAKSTDPSISTGYIAQKDLKRYGYISLDFYVNEKSIGVDIAGFSTFLKYTYFPINQKEILQNDRFLEHVNKCEDSETVKQQLNIKP